MGDSNAKDKHIDQPHNAKPALDAGAESALRRSFSPDEIVTEARNWIKTHYPDTDSDTRKSRLGLLIDFVTDIVPHEKSEP